MHQSFSFRPIITCFSIFAITFCAHATNLDLDPHENSAFQKYDTNLSNNNQQQPSSIPAAPTNIPTPPNAQAEINNIREHSAEMQYQKYKQGPVQIKEYEMPKHSHASQQQEPKPVKIAKKSNYREISEVELQRMISSLHEADQKVILNIQKQISNWPESVFKEVRNYNEFMIVANRKAKEKYMALSAPARQALETEQTLKNQLSEDAINVLSKLNPN